MNRPKKIKIVEVGPRDGLQNEKTILKTEVKAHFIQLLSDSGLKEIEASSFVRGDKIPQMSDASELFIQLQSRKLPCLLTYLVPNLQGLDSAIKKGVRRVAVFTSTSETFNKKNINASISQSLLNIEEVTKKAKGQEISLRGYISTVFGCPYEGEKKGKAYQDLLLKMVEKLFSLGIDEVSLGDTIGVATPDQVLEISNLLLKNFDSKKIALHFHDTRGMAIANILTALNTGIEIFDSSAGGLGGCPYAQGASGNVATEDLIYLFESLNIETGVDLKKVIIASQYILKELKKETTSKYLQYVLKRENHG